MFRGTIEQNPIGDKVRGTNLYRLSHTADGDYSGCRRCSLAAGRRYATVGYVGRRHYEYGEYYPRIMCIGLAPRGTEDVSGVAFLGQEGRILKAIFKLIPFDFNFYCTYLVCCRTGDILYNGEFLENEESEYVGEVEFYEQDRLPNKKEIIACSSHITEIVKDYRPSLVFSLGKYVTKHVRHLNPIELESLEYIAKLEYKLLTVRKQARIMTREIKEVFKAYGKIRSN